MTTRRTFIKTLSGGPAALYFPRSWAVSPDPSRLAMVMGNGAYRQAPLLNPANDAKAVAALFAQAGFTVDSNIDLARNDMLAAFERFGQAANRSDTKLLVLYYAGHGVQLDWRNFLAPVDAVVEKQEDMQRHCVDLNFLLGNLVRAKDKTFVIILDACRENPFGASYRPEQKGLSQFDAPVNSLLAYATSPGNVAYDGEGKNGLYTEHLLRELSRRGTRIEDDFKRVRLAVRLASHGEQIPWESTSLESDVFVFNEEQEKPSDAEIERQTEAEIDEWTRIKSSRKIDDWVNYLRTFPNGRFAEIAQTRLNHLLEQVEKAKPLPVTLTPAASSQTAPAPPQAAPHAGEDTQEARPAAKKQVPSQATGAFTAAPISPPISPPRPAALDVASIAPTVVIESGAPIPPLFTASANPHTVGSYPLGRKFTVGDEFEIVVYNDLFTRLGVHTTLKVTSVDEDQDRVDLNRGAYVWDTMGNIIQQPDYALSDTPRQFFPAEIQIGKKWTACWIDRSVGKKRGTVRLAPVTIDLRIAALEIVSVPAGQFNAFRIVFNGWQGDGGHRHEGNLWLVPGLNVCVKFEHSRIGKHGAVGTSYGYELVALRQQRIDDTALPLRGKPNRPPST